VEKNQLIPGCVWDCLGRKYDVRVETVLDWVLKNIRFYELSQMDKKKTCEDNGGKESV
jgi:hypothetical protein